MVYMGSKNRIAKELIPIITKYLKPEQCYVEPFVGGCNMIDKINHPYRLGADNNRYLIALLQIVQDGQELPEYITKEEYQEVKANKDNYPDWYIGFVGFISSYNGCFFSSYAGLVNIKDGKQRNYIKEKRNNLLKQYESIKGITFKCASYDNLDIPFNSIIYCDPPYNNTSSYHSVFDSDKFWQWCRDKIKEGHTVFVSEYNAPEDFICIWEKNLKASFCNATKGSVEKLFIHKSQLR